MQRRKTYATLMIAVGGPFLAATLLYWGWCWGWWGRGNVVLQYLLQCNCPRASEAARYPERFEVLISACQDATIQVSPGGRFLRVYGERPTSGYLLDFQTDTKLPSPVTDTFGFITDDLLLVSTGPANINVYLLDRQSREKYPVTRLDPERLPGGTLEDGSVNPDVMLPFLQSASMVFATGRGVLIVGLPSEQFSTPNYLIDERDWLGPYWEGGASRDGELTRQYLKANEIPYVDVYAQWHDPEGLPSHSGAFIAKREGIYRRSMNERVVESYAPPSYDYFVPIGWVYDDRGVLLQSPWIYLLDLRSFYLSNYMRVPQPVLLLKVPEEYLRLTQ